ncbi:hypothetical protein Tco_0138505 [Tanacetum coccineum]
MTIPFLSRLNGYHCEEKKGLYGPGFSEAYSEASIPRKEKDPIRRISADKTVKYPKGIAKNVLVGIGKFVFPVDFIILDMPEDIKVPLILRKPFLSTARAKIERNQGDDLMPTIEEGEIIEQFRTRYDELDAEIDDYPRALMNVPIFVGTFSVVMDFAVLENMDAYRDEGMGGHGYLCYLSFIRGECKDIYWMSYLVWYYPTTIPDTTPFVIPPTTHNDTTLIPIVSPTIPPLPDYTPASPDYSLASDMKFNPFEDPSSDHIPPLPTTSPFLSSTNDSSDNDIPDTPPSPTHSTPFTETTLSTQSSPIVSGALRHRVMVLAPGQPIPHGRPYRYHLNGPIHMMTARDSSSSSSLETSLDTSADALSDYASSCSSFDHSLPAPSLGMRPSYYLCSLVPSIPRSSTAISDRLSHDSSSTSPSRKRSRPPTASVPLSLPTLGALSYARADLLPLPKRIRSSKSATNLEVSTAKGFKPSRYRGTNLEMDVDVVRSDGIDIDPEIQAEIDEFKAIDREEIETGMRGPVEVRVDRVTHPVVADDIPELAQEGVVEVTYETLGNLVQRFHDHTEEILVCCLQVIESVQRDQGYRIVLTGQKSANMLERIREVKRDYMRLRDMMDVTRGLLGLRHVPGSIWATILRLFHEYPSVDP